MLIQVVSFILDVVAGLFGGACLLRWLMNWRQTGFRNPVGRFVCALTDWIVLPLRKLVPQAGRFDAASLLAAYLFELAQFLLLGLLLDTILARAPLLALFGLARLALSGLMGLVIVYVILSWVQAGSALGDVIGKLCAPLLRPIRRVLPLVGGFDLSPLVLLVLLQVALFLLGGLQAAVLAASV